MHLIVDDEPMLLLGGQLHNSSPSSPEYLAPLWDRLSSMHVGTVIGSASWELVEPTEGTFDFSLVDDQISQARSRGMRLALIWFGAFKNAVSTYAPRWVRADPDRFPRARLEATSRPAFTYEGGMPRPVLSVFSDALREADCRAFTAFVGHLASVDTDHTVVMVQVENEVGVLGDHRDRSALALAAWQAPVPGALIDYLVGHANELRPEFLELWSGRGRRTSGTWSEVFGTDWRAGEVFMAWAFASYVETLAAAGKGVKALPMYANAWLGPQPGQLEAGQYPSGGPARRVLDVWKAAAPSLDLLAPDIYVDDAAPVLADYHRRDNPLFVPEAQFRAGTAFLALGRHHAIGFSVFGVDDGRPDSQVARAYALLRSMGPVITSAQADGRIAGILLDHGESETTIGLGGYDIVARDAQALIGRLLLDAGLQAPPPPPAPPSETEGTVVASYPGDSRPFGLLIYEADDTFLLAGQGLTLDFFRPDALVEVDHVEEGRFDRGRWRPGRALNGDERLFTLPPGGIGAVRVRLLTRPAPMPGPAGG
jgi:beta-galactosidase GanA